MDTTTITTPTRTTYPDAEYRPVANQSTGIIQPTRGLIPHAQAGTGSLYGHFNDPASETSAHLWLSKDGRFEQYVPFDRRAWAQGTGDEDWISCVCEGCETEDYTDIQIQRLGEFYLWGMKVFGWPAEVTDSTEGHGIGTHRMGGAEWGGQSCPGTIRADRRHDILAAAELIPELPADPGPDPGPSDPHDQFEHMPLLRQGMTNPAVATLQKALNIIFRHEALSDPHGLRPNWYYGPSTTARVASLQHYATPWFGRIPVDGICGPNTWRKMAWILTGMNRSVDE